jgi:hypothetical protein
MKLLQQSAHVPLQLQQGKDMERLQLLLLQQPTWLPQLSQR